MLGWATYRCRQVVGVLHEPRRVMEGQEKGKEGT